MFSWLFKRRPTPAAPVSLPAETPPAEIHAAAEPAPPPPLFNRAWVEAVIAAADLGPEAVALWPASASDPDISADETLLRAFLADLRRHRLRDPARAVARALVDILPGVTWPLLELAAALGQAPEAQEALDLGTRLQQADPSLPDGQRLILHGLRGLGRRDEAAAFFDALPESLADLDWYLVSGIHICWTRGESDRVIALAERLRQVSPGRTMGFTMASVAHRARQEPALAEAVIARALETLGNYADVWGEAARVAQTLGNYELAFERWAELRRRFPRSPAGHIGAIQLSLRVGQPEQTDRLLADAVAAFPDHRDILVHAARNAMQGEDMESAGRYWRAAVAAAPEDPALHLRAAMSQLGTGRTRRQRTPETIEQLATINAAFPQFVPAAIARLGLLRDVGRFDEADVLAQEWVGRLPDNQALAIAHARIAENRGDLAAAVDRIVALRSRIPPNGPLEAAYVRVLSVAGRHEEADAACVAARQSFPNDVNLLCEWSTLAMRNGDWSAALQRAEAALRVRPQDQALHRILQRARIQVVPADEALPGEDNAAPEAAAIPAPGAAPAEPGLAEFFARFESLGATMAGCEFGIVQRRFGCEPLGLLRWARIDLEGLITSLDNGFEGMGEPENTQLLIREEGIDHQEYYVEDSRIGYSTHTFVTVQDTSFDRMLKQSLRRLVFLRSKLLEDLRAGEKIFVFKLARSLATPEALTRLHDAILRYSNSTLLCVTLADEEHPKGTLEMLRPGLFLGRAGTFMGLGRAGAAGIETQQWRLFCEQVAQWHDQAAPVPA
jgi:tetratricopeptide (TPR) repeat protein